MTVSNSTKSRDRPSLGGPKPAGLEKAGEAVTPGESPLEMPSCGLILRPLPICSDLSSWHLIHFVSLVPYVC